MKKIIIIYLLFLLIFSFLILDFGFKDKSFEESKKFYFENKEALDKLNKEIISQNNFIRTRITYPGMGIFSCNQPFKKVDIVESFDQYEIPVVYSIENIKDCKDLKEWCDEKHVNFDLIIQTCDIAIKNDLELIGRYNIYKNYFEVFFSNNTKIIHIQDSSEIEKIEGDEIINIEDNWFYVAKFN